MAEMQQITCKCGCGQKKLVRTADVKRGWGKFYSKSCKARYQEQRTGQYRRHQRRQERQDDYVGDGDGHPFESGPEGHGQE